MKTKTAVSLVTVLCSSIAWAAEPGSSTAELQAFPKNLARQHLGSNLFVFNSSSQSFAPTEAAAAWLDDDVTTAWPVMAGKQHYLLVLSEPELITNFSVSGRPASGTVTLYGGDEPATPGANSWVPIAKDIPFDSINNKKLGRSFNRLAKYVLIETDIAEPGPLYSLYLYGEKPAVSYSLRKREQPIDARAVFGPYVNDQTNFNVNGLYASGRVAYSNSPEGYLSWQKAIDDNPETGVTLAGTAADAGAVISFGSQRYVSRISALTDVGAKGQLDFYVVNAASETTGAARTAMPVADQTATVSLVFDGTNPRASIDLPATEGTELAMRWTPATEGETLTLRELNAFDKLSLNDYEVVGTLSAVAAYASGDGDGKSFKEFKEMIDPKKNPLPVAAAPATPYLPGSLGFPPILNSRKLPPPEPESN
jgi:hypothetical protein